jgi:hypothetical protein
LAPIRQLLFRFSIHLLAELLLYLLDDMIMGITDDEEGDGAKAFDELERSGSVEQTMSNIEAASKRKFDPTGSKGLTEKSVYNDMHRIQVDALAMVRPASALTFAT